MIMRRRRILQLLACATAFVFYVQFQLFSFTERRLFLKKITLALQSSEPGQQLNVDEVCSQSRGTAPASAGPSRSSNGLTLMTWDSEHIKDLSSFIDFPQFPKHPVTVQFGMKSALRLPFSSSTGGWLTGSLLAPASGKYRFGISSSGEAQLRLSTDDESDKSRTIASLLYSTRDAPRPISGKYDKYPTQTSLSIYLQKCRSYYIEVLFHNDHTNGHVEIAWETPSSLTYEVIPMLFLSSYIDAHDFAHSGEGLLIFEDTIKTSSLFWRLVNEKRSIEREPVDGWGRLPFMSTYDADHVLPKCSANMNGRSSGTRLQIPKTNSERTKRFFVEYTKVLVKANKGKYSFSMAHESDEKLLHNQGRRYLINLEFQDNMMNMRVRVSEYLFYENSKRELCVISGFKWRRDAMVTIVAVIREMGSWSHYFMDHLSELTTKLQDARFSVIIVAPKRMKQYFQRIVLQNRLAWQSHLTLLLLNAIKQMQNLQNVINVAISYIKVPNTIIFFTDIRVQMSSNILEQVRKQTVEGRTVFMPWPVNFNKGFYENATIINPLDTSQADHPPSFALYVSDWKHLTDWKATAGPKNAGSTGQTKNWWQAIENGALEVYASKMPKFFYFQKKGKEK